MRGVYNMKSIKYVTIKDNPMKLATFGIILGLFVCSFAKVHSMTLAHQEAQKMVNERNTLMSIGKNFLTASGFLATGTVLTLLSHDFPDCTENNNFNCIVVEPVYFYVFPVATAVCSLISYDYLGSVNQRSGLKILWDSLRHRIY